MEGSVGLRGWSGRRQALRQASASTRRERGKPGLEMEGSPVPLRRWRCGGWRHACSMQVVTKKACLCGAGAAVPLPSFLSCMLPRCGLCELARAEEREHSADLRVQPTARAKVLLGYIVRRGGDGDRLTDGHGHGGDWIGRQTVSLSQPAGHDRAARGSRPSSLPECPGPDAIANCNCMERGGGRPGGDDGHTTQIDPGTHTEARGERESPRAGYTDGGPTALLLSLFSLSSLSLQFPGHRKNVGLYNWTYWCNRRINKTQL